MAYSPSYVIHCMASALKMMSLKLLRVCVWVYHALCEAHTCHHHRDEVEPLGTHDLSCRFTKCGIAAINDIIPVSWIPCTSIHRYLQSDGKQLDECQLSHGRVEGAGVGHHLYPDTEESSGVWSENKSQGFHCHGNKIGFIIILNLIN